MQTNINVNEETSASQAKQILNYLKQGNSITPKDAMILFGCERLSARIFDLRALGNDIKCELVQVSTRKKVGRYWIQG